ncbi:DNA-3-methyladenine glycosylase I [Luteibacter sp. PPL201]|jgi:DNA-3-methyladenine glycosylase I|uniref:DNA-3-methyladenine glycosylase I n=1 Tax=Luteibacter sahnii TaxID=3021977 RepID=A0ABT6BEX8_9GAMM|nr:DNA-3-methyladenine glycosylase I [Luteibacter sp. PPL193]MDY1549689.1 DNA-3-methyladenine glycosylase I [Luteibacter sp. PPL193]
MRCDGTGSTDAERIYHDTEWGVPLRDEGALFELLVLRGAQAGLAWRTVLAKRAAYRRAFLDYDIDAVAALDDAAMARIALDRGLIRHRLKLASVRINARAVQAMRRTDGAFGDFLWSFVDGRTIVNRFRRDDPLPSRSSRSDRMSDALRRRGFRFAGTAICYALMQSAGLVDDHQVGCFRRERE